MYKFFKFFLFLFPPEKVHKITTSFLAFILKIPFMDLIIRSLYHFHDPRLETKLLGLTFKNPVGLAAGFDKNAQLIDNFSNFGFGFIEIGTLTPKNQLGNPKPRLFRLPKDKALINRMGFNNDGVETAVGRLKKRKTTIIVGGNIGKNKMTKNEDALKDYLICFEKLYNYVDYFVVNVSSPNTPGLRDLQEKEPLKKILNALHTENKKKIFQKPILLKIAPDLTKLQLNNLIEITKELNLSGLVISNTTINRKNLKTNLNKIKTIGLGGLSGKPVFDKSTDILKYVRKHLPFVPIIAVGGIHSATDAVQKIKAGANLIQIYTGLVYEGPGLIKKINKELLKYV